jgi:hypothetical protein
VPAGGRNAVEGYEVPSIISPTPAMVITLDGKDVMLSFRVFSVCERDVAGEARKAPAIRRIMLAVLFTIFEKGD